MRPGNGLPKHPIPKCRSLNAQSDEALINAVAAGDQAAMRTLYVRHNASVLRFIARMLNDAGRAEDLVSEVFIDVWIQAEQLSRPVAGIDLDPVDCTP
jgi:Sigma-70 region 2